MNFFFFLKVGYPDQTEVMVTSFLLLFPFFLTSSSAAASSSSSFFKFPKLKKPKNLLSKEFQDNESQ